MAGGCLSLSDGRLVPRMASDQQGKDRRGKVAGIIILFTLFELLV